jgi:tRNA dimethylallyltransferase
VVQTNSIKPKIIILCGPTGVGKSEIALRLAEAIGGEIIVADSQAVLRGLDVGTAKPSAEDRARVPHHLMDVANYGEVFDVATYATLAERAIEEIISHKKYPIVSGGTGLYIKALLFGMMEAPKRDDALREKLEAQAAKQGLPILYQELQSIDPKRASEIHPHDANRIIRALEIYHLMGKPPSKLAESHGFQEMRYEALKIGLKRPREELIQRINDRVIEMMRRGWVEEVKGLMAKGIDLIHGKTKTIGYPTLAKYLQGEMSLEEATQEIQKETRQLAKRQMTWFRVDEGIKWFHPEEWEEILGQAQKWLTMRYNKYTI